MRLRQVHLDFHTSECIANIGSAFDKRQFQEALKQGHVDSITVFSKCHHGWAYHPSEANEMHPNLTFDLLAAQIEAAHEIGVLTPVYISAGLDQKYATRHPEHLTKKLKNGEIVEQDFTRPRFQHLCLNTPYMDTLLAQIEETVSRYDLDGLFLDIVSPSNSCCVCDTCIALMRAKGLDPMNEDDYRAFGEASYIRYTERVKEVVHRIKPGLKIFHNGGNTPRGKRYLERLNSHIEIESLPTGGWGYDNLPMTARSVQSHGMEYLGMTGKFHKGWGEFGGYKHPNALIYETALSVANGAACSIGDQLHPLGRADDATYRLIGAAYAEIERREPWLTDVTAVADIAFYSYEAYLARHPEEKKADPEYKDTDTGVLRMLLEGNYLFDIVDGENDLSNYRVVILPDRVRMDDTLREQLAPFLQNGGKILASGVSALDGTDFAYDLGAKYLGPRDISPVYLTPVTDGMDVAGYVHYAPAERIERNEDASLVSVLHEPYFNRTFEHFCSHLHAPQKFGDAEAGITLGKDGAYISVQIFREYAKIGCGSAKQFVTLLLDLLLKDQKRVSVENFPVGGITTMMRQKDRTILHLVYAPRVTKGEKHIEVIEDCPALTDIGVTVRLGHPVSAVTLVPEGTPIPHTVSEDGALSFTIPKAGIHTMVVFDD